MSPYAQVNTHLFGAYASVYPFQNDTLGITVGYAGTFMQNLETFGALDSEAAMPSVLKNGINLAARYKTDRLTIKTDHNVSFWADKNYKIFYLYNPNAQYSKDYGLLAKTNVPSHVSDVNHTFIWNGIGASYHFNDLIEGSVYVRNLIRIDETPEMKMLNDYFSLELKSIFRPHKNVEAYAGITYQLTSRSVSKSLATEVDEFEHGEARDTTDVLHRIQIPIGVTVKLQ
jgi:hypothetical protein